MRVILRLLSIISLAIATVMAVVDLTASIAASTWTYTPLRQSWAMLHTQSLTGLQSLAESKAPLLWDPILTNMLALPGWLVFTVLSLVLYWLGRKRQRLTDFLANND